MIQSVGDRGNEDLYNFWFFGHSKKKILLNIDETLLSFFLYLGPFAFRDAQLI